MLPMLGRAETRCPAWCARRHGALADGAATVHVSGALQVHRTVLRVVSTVDRAGRTQDGPYVVVGQQEYTLHEAEVLIAALTQLVDQTRAASPAGAPRTPTPGP